MEYHNGNDQLKIFKILLTNGKYLLKQGRPQYNRKMQIEQNQIEISEQAKIMTKSKSQF